jgi:8-oxo-dGTP pyrophosphatase MutT (NUDIX family)
MSYTKDHQSFLNKCFWGSEASGVLPICKTTGKILIGLRNEWVNEPFTWGNFGGAIGLSHSGHEEEALTPENNALKEMQEEINYTGHIEMIPSFVFKKQGFTYYNFLGLVDEEFSPDLEADYHAEIIKAKWVTLDEFLNHLDLHFGLKSLIGNALPQIKQYAR